MEWRPMEQADIAPVGDLSAAIHDKYRESPAVYAERLRLFPAGCHVLADEDGIHGFLVGHPWIAASPPLLDRPLGGLPPAPDCYYLHDLALAPETRGRGLARVAVGKALDTARQAGLPRVTLIAVNDAFGFWSAQGFTPVGDGRLPPEKGYGPEARFMERPLPG